MLICNLVIPENHKLMTRIFLICLLLSGMTVAVAQPPCDHALSFSGFNSYVDCGPGSNFHAEGQLTVEAWINLPDVTTNQKIAGNIDPFSNSGFELGIQNGGIYCEVKDTFGLQTFTAVGVPAGVWTHIAMTYRVSGRFRGYINGVLVADQPATNQPIGDNGTTNFRIGVAPWDPNYFAANGQIDEVRVWDTERSREQLRKNMRIEQTPPLPGLIGYWKFSEGTGSSTSDASGYNHNGVLSGITLPSWQNAAGPYGFGGADLNAGTGVMGAMAFPAAAADMMFNVSPTTDTFVVSRINCEPGGTQPAGSATFNNGYWIIDRYGSSTPMNYALTLHFPAGTVSAADSVTPSNLLLYNRSGYSTSGWVNNAFAGAASPYDATVTFPFISVTGQFKAASNGSSTLSVPDNGTVQEGFKVYPNPLPAGQELFVSSPLETGVVRIIDSSGRLVLMQSLNGTVIPSTGLSPGPYKMILSDSRGSFIQTLVVTGR
jgi:hypothetical protein